jgi:hypothetical protein
MRVEPSPTFLYGTLFPDHAKAQRTASMGKSGQNFNKVIGNRIKAWRAFC